MVFLVAALCSGLAFWPRFVQADLLDKSDGKTLAAVKPDLDYLIAQVGSGATSFDPSKVKALLSFVSIPHLDCVAVKPDDLGKASGAFWQFGVKTPLARVGNYFFNPDVPPQAVLPGAVRLGGWHKNEAATRALGAVWKTLPGAKAPVVASGLEFEESTPDASSGVYYRYDVKRYVAVFNDQGRDVVISVSRLKAPSVVGKKGAAVGSPSDWNFFYSGLKGNLMKGLGWADSYIYDSCSVYVFIEPAPGKPLTTVGLFKWIDAGWSNLNVVKRANILEGCKQFAAAFTEMLESPRLPSAEEIAKQAASVAALSEDALRERLKPLAQLLEKIMPSNPKLSREEFAPIIKDAGYAKILSKEQMQSELVKDFVRKAMLGKSFTSEAAAASK